MISKGRVRVFLLSKLVETLTALLALVFVSFLLLHLMPGGPFDEEVLLNPVVRGSLQKLWALDQPFFVQLFKYIQNLLHGDFGTSMVQTGKSVSAILQSGFANTLTLNLLAIATAYVFAFLTSALANLWASSWMSRGIEGLNIMAISLPSLFLGPVLIYFFGFKLNLLPTAFLTTEMHYILPVVTLALRPWAQMNLLLTNSLQETLKQDYIRTAKAKGLSKFRILFSHAYKNSLMPIVSMSPPLIVGLISGSFLVEILFSIQGLGQQFVESLNLRDYPVIMAMVIIYGASLILLTHIFDMLATWLDPRIRGLK